MVFERLLVINNIRMPGRPNREKREQQRGCDDEAALIDTPPRRAPITISSREITGCSRFCGVRPTFGQTMKVSGKTGKLTDGTGKEVENLVLDPLGDEPWVIISAWGGLHTNKGRLVLLEIPQTFVVCNCTKHVIEK